MDRDAFPKGFAALYGAAFNVQHLGCIYSGGAEGNIGGRIGVEVAVVQRQQVHIEVKTALDHDFLPDLIGVGTKGGTGRGLGRGGSAAHLDGRGGAAATRLDVARGVEVTIQHHTLDDGLGGVAHQAEPLPVAWHL